MKHIKTEYGLEIERMFREIRTLRSLYPSEGTSEVDKRRLSVRASLLFSRYRQSERCLVASPEDVYLNELLNHYHGTTPGNPVAITPYEVNQNASLPISQTGLSKRTARILIEDMGLNLIGEVARFSEQELLRIKGLGRTTLKEIVLALNVLGLEAATKHLDD